MADDAPLGRPRWLDPDSDTVAAALRAYHGDDDSWRAPFRTRQAENLERHCMALALETALPDPNARQPELWTLDKWIKTHVAACGPVTFSVESDDLVVRIGDGSSTVIEGYAKVREALT